MEYYLQHHGIKDMKWGKRRFQNEDGTLTEAGKKRYARDAREKGYKKYDESSGSYYKTSGKKNKREDLDVDSDRWVKENRERTKRLTDETRHMTNTIKNITDKSIKNAPRETMDLSNMTDQEMRNQINRAMLERQYNDMFAPRQQTKGREYVSQILEVAGDALAVTSSALAIALAIKELRG